MTFEKTVSKVKKVYLGVKVDNFRGTCLGVKVSFFGGIIK
jgi:hypothetical protein